MSIQIKEIAFYLPDLIVKNSDLKVKHPDWDMTQVEDRTGVIERHIASEKETALNLAVEASKKLLTSELNKDTLDALIFCSQSSDYILPGNSFILHKELGLPENVFVFDFNLACSGYVYGLAICKSLIASGIANNVLFVTSDTYSKYIHEEDRSARALFGDGASASWINASADGQGVIDILCATYGKFYDKFIIPAGGCRLPKSESTKTLLKDHSGNTRTAEHIHMDGMGILSFVNAKVPEQVRVILQRNNLTVNDIDIFIFHQASKMVLDSLTRLLKLDPNKVFRNIDKIGNTVSSSIPICLKQAKDAGLIKPGSKVLISGFGVGLSYATALINY